MNAFQWHARSRWPLGRRFVIPGLILLSFLTLVVAPAAQLSAQSTGPAVMLTDTQPGPDPNASAWPRSMIDAGGVIVFVASNSVTGSELWRTDGTAAGTVLVKDI